MTLDLSKDERLIVILALEDRMSLCDRLRGHSERIGDLSAEERWRERTRSVEALLVRLKGGAP